MAISPMLISMYTHVSLTDKRVIKVPGFYQTAPSNRGKVCLGGRIVIDVIVINDCQIQNIFVIHRVPDNAANLSCVLPESKRLDLLFVGEHILDDGARDVRCHLLQAL